MAFVKRRWLALMAAFYVAAGIAHFVNPVDQVHPAHAPTWMGVPGAAALRLRLPLQGVLVSWAWWHTSR